MNFLIDSVLGPGDCFQSPKMPASAMQTTGSVTGWPDFPTGQLAKRGAAPQLSLVNINVDSKLPEMLIPSRSEARRKSSCVAEIRMSSPSVGPST